MSTIGYRLREERDRLGLSQTDLGKTVGVGKQSQINYESDKRSPDARYLAAAAGLGVDVLYVLTGTRTGGAPAPTRGRIDATQLLEVYELIEFVARKAGKRWSERKKVELAIKGYNILIEEGPQETTEARYARVLGIVERV